MATQLIDTIPNFSECRRPEMIEAIVERLKKYRVVICWTTGQKKTTTCWRSVWCVDLRRSKTL